MKKTYSRLAMLAALFIAQMLPLHAANYETTEIAPGVWRIRIGTPEAATPANYRTIQPDVEGMKQLPASVRTIPVDPSRIFALATPRGLRIEMPYEGEVIYGLGLQVENFQQQGLLRFLMNNAAGLNGLGPTHAAFPYYISAKGYAVYIDTARYTTMRIGTNPRKSHELEKNKGPKSIIAGDDNDAKGQTAEDVATDRTTTGKPFLVEIPAAQGVDIYVFAGPTMMDAVQRYNLYSGGGVLPELSGLAPKFRMQSLASQEHVFSLINRFRDRQLPFSTIALEPGWHTKSYPCTFNWNHERYNHKELIAEFKRLHYKLDLWEHPYIYHESTYYNDFYDVSGDYAVFGGLVPDLADPKGMKVYERIHSDLIEMGASSFKIDANDNLFLKGNRVHPWPDSAMFPSGLDGMQMHQLYGILTQQGVMKPFVDRNLRTFGETRCSGPFAAPYPFVLFSDMGDQTDYFRMMLTGGFCGLLWQPEIRRASTNTFDEYYARIQMAVLSPALTFNNYMMPTPAWFQMNPNKNKDGEHYPEAEIRAKEDIIRELLNQRMALIPYLYSAYRTYELTGKPPFRALVLDYPNDPKCAGIDNQIMVGESIMGYVFLKKAQTVRVYLPEGTWYDYNTGERYEGGQHYTMKFSPTMIPAFVKSGALLPLAKPVQYVDRNTVFDITVRVYGDTTASFVLYEDDGETYDYKKGAQTAVTLKWDSKNGGSVSRKGGYKQARYNIVAWQQIYGKDSDQKKAEKTASNGKTAAKPTATGKTTGGNAVQTATAQLDGAIDKLQTAKLLSPEDAAYLRENARPGGRVSGAPVARLITALAEYLGGPVGNYTEALNTLKAKKVLSPSNKAWDKADQPDDEPHMGGGTGMNIVKFASFVK